MSEQLIKNTTGIGRTITKKVTPIEKVEPNILAVEGRVTTLEGNITSFVGSLSGKLDASLYTANDVLTKIKTVDGSGSGLDADLLDGHHATYFAIANTTPNINDIYDKTEVDGLLENISNNVYDKTEIDNLFNENIFSESLNPNGWCELPNGVILQWGEVESTSDADQTFTFPKSFTNACYNVQLTRHYSGGSTAINVKSFFTTGFVINRDNGFDGTHYFYYFAIGK